jgi:hypothetical protein
MKVQDIMALEITLKYANMVMCGRRKMKTIILQCLTEIYT